MTPTTSTIIPMVQTMAIFAMNPIKIGFLRLEVVFPAADGVTDHPEHCQDDADHQHNNSDGPDDGNLRDEPDNQQDDAENDQLWLLAVATIVRPRRSEERR